MFGFSKKEKLIKDIRLSKDKLKKNIEAVANPIIGNLDIFFNVFEERLKKISSLSERSPEEITKFEFNGFLEQLNLAPVRVADELNKYLKIELEVATELDMRKEYDKIIHDAIQKKLVALRIAAKNLRDTKLNDF